MECGGKLQSNNQVVASQDRVIFTRLKMIYFLFADRRRRRRRRTAGRRAAAAGKKHAARRQQPTD